MTAKGKKNANFFKNFLFPPQKKLGGGTGVFSVLQNSGNSLCERSLLLYEKHFASATLVESHFGSHGHSAWPLFGLVRKTGLFSKAERDFERRGRATAGSHPEADAAGQSKNTANSLPSALRLLVGAGWGIRTRSDLNSSSPHEIIDLTVNFPFRRGNVLEILVAGVLGRGAKCIFRKRKGRQACLEFALRPSVCFWKKCR